MSSASATLRGIVALSFALSLSQFFRGCLAVIAPELQHDLRLSPAGFGALSSCFFLAFGLAQVPVGIAFDRWGVGRPTRWLLLLGTASSLLFMVAPSGPVAMLAQVGLGLACAPVFMGLMHFTLAALSPQRSVVVLGRANAMGMLGALAATAPLGWAAHAWGWRSPLLLAAVAMALACLGVWRWVRDEGHADARAESLTQMLAGSLQLLRRPALWTLIPLCVAMAAGTTFRNAWGGPYFADVFGLPAGSRGLALAVLSGMGVLAAVGLPWLVHRSSLRGTVTRGAIVGLAAAVLLARWPALGLGPNLALLAVLVTIGMLHPLVMSHGRELLPPAQRGRGLGVLNSFVFMGSAFASWLFGQVADAGQQRGWSEPFTYSAIFGLAALLALAGLLPYLRSPVPPSDLTARR
ncbi:MAG: MFS transporter [Comamonadaceae bacterium]|nr:MAG: MFS transporter [Comamonadaceae bacterium]